MICYICNWNEVRSKGLMCEACARSYDRAREKDVTVWSAIVWAARRARRFERHAFAQYIANGITRKS